jgi:hypothetical protein
LFNSFIIIIDHFAKAEVSNFDSLVMNEYVLGLDVPVNNPVLLHIFESLDDFLQNNECFVFR